MESKPGWRNISEFTVCYAMSESVKKDKVILTLTNHEYRLVQKIAMDTETRAYRTNCTTAPIITMEL